LLLEDEASYLTETMIGREEPCAFAALLTRRGRIAPPRAAILARRKPRSAFRSIAALAPQLGCREEKLALAALFRVFHTAEDVARRFDSLISVLSANAAGTLRRPTDTGSIPTPPTKSSSCRRSAAAGWSPISVSNRRASICIAGRACPSSDQGLTALKEEIDFPDEVPHHPLQQAVYDVHAAFDNYFAGLKKRREFAMRGSGARSAGNRQRWPTFR